MNETEKFNSGSAYSPVELFGEENQHAIVLLMHEQNTLRGQDFYKALIKDSVYSNTSFKANTYKIKCLAECLPNDFKNITLNFINALNNEVNVDNIFVKDLYHAAKLGKAYARLNKLEYVGYYQDKTQTDRSKKAFARSLQLKHLCLLTKDVIKKEPFKIPDSGSMNTPFKDLHFWQWLDQTGYNGTQDTILTKIKYLVSLGFNKGLHTLNERDYQILSHTQTAYYDINFKYKKV